MARILLGVTGSVAAIKTPELFRAFQASGHEVRVVATRHATYFFDPAELDPKHVVRNPAVVTLDDDEWPGRDRGRRYVRGDEVTHIELRRWADLYVIAPIDANTLAKLANGICDNCVTCVWRAWDPERACVIAPAMNTLMWNHPMTGRHLRSVAVDQGASHIPAHFDLQETMAQINARCPNFGVVPPVSKTLACGDVGEGAMAEVPQIVDAVNSRLVRIVPSP
jgi:phosphopantothenoylcysteine decarboxylase